jgi:hypothetical protein
MAILSSSLLADFGYGYSNVRNQDTGGSAYNNQSFTKAASGQILGLFLWLLFPREKIWEL